MTVRELEKFYVNLDCASNADCVYDFNPSQSILYNPSNYDVSVVSALLNVKLPTMVIDKRSDFYKNLKIGFYGGSYNLKVTQSSYTTYDHYDKYEDTNIKNLLYYLRDKSFDYIKDDNIIVIKYQNFFKCLNLIWNLIYEKAPNLYNQVQYTSSSTVETYSTNFYRLCTIPPYIEYKSKSNITFYQNYIPPDVRSFDLCPGAAITYPFGDGATNESVGWYVNIELATFFQDLFGSVAIFNVVKRILYKNETVGYSNRFAKYESLKKAPDESTNSYITSFNKQDATTVYNMSNNNTSVLSDVWPIGGCNPTLDYTTASVNWVLASPNLDLGSRYGSSGLWSYGQHAYYKGSNYPPPTSATSANPQSIGMLIPYADITSISLPSTGTYNTFVVSFYLGTTVPAPAYDSGQNNIISVLTKAGRKMLREFNYERDTLDYDTTTGYIKISNDSIVYSSRFEDYFVRNMSCPYGSGTNRLISAYMYPCIERIGVKTITDITALQFPITRIDLVSNNLQQQSETVLSSENTIYTFKNILRSFIIDDSTVSSTEESIIYTPQSEILRMDLKPASNVLTRINLEVWCYLSTGQYFLMKSFKRSTIKLMFTKKHL